MLYLPVMNYKTRRVQSLSEKFSLRLVYMHTYTHKCIYEKIHYTYIYISIYIYFYIYIFTHHSSEMEGELP